MSPDSLVHTAAEQARSVVLQMMAERGRGVVLVGIARIDLALERLLKAVMAPTDESDDALFRPERSLGSFAAKISLASRLALIDPAVAKALLALRSVRNDVAHSADDTSPRRPLPPQTPHPRLRGSPRQPSLAPAGGDPRSPGRPRCRPAPVHPAGHGAGGLHRILRPPPAALPAPRHGAFFWGLNGPEAL